VRPSTRFALMATMALFGTGLLLPLLGESFAGGRRGA